ncbi:glycosyltransferase family 2 protein [Marispirochaeta sp.]|uniref:glycosyltransferase family 2 protein n=1 Tax=Marispirochaeta sp. TaxID=2038653 RepID=UPI0029C95AC1|nr:glycosyltransferase family 2 protein [Marispirochaeta sp.]
MISVIMPAYNEEAFIERSLRSLCSGAALGELEIIVVCNGCTDSTASKARKVSGPIKVLETGIPSKTNAMNIGDEIATGFPRFYVDADLIFSLDDLRKVAAVLNKNGVMAAAPEFVFDVIHSSSAVKAYYRVWKQMPYFDTGRIAGAYGLSREGRTRFGRFPTLTSDDGFVRLQFTPSERTTVKGSSALVSTPRKLSSLIKIKIRSQSGTTELRKKFPSLFRNETASPKSSLQRLLHNRFSTYEKLVYVCVSILARMGGKLNLFLGRKTWARDESSRELVAK